MTHVVPGRLCGASTDDGLVHASADAGSMGSMDWSVVTCPACIAARDMPHVQRKPVRTVFVRIAIETDASELDIANGADALETKLRDNGAIVKRGWLAVDYPTPQGSADFWKTAEQTPTQIAEVCPACGGKNHPREFAWYAEHFERIAKRVKKTGRGTILERKLLAASVDLAAVQRRLGTLCGSQAGQAAKDRLTAVVRELMAQEASS